jgi:hypothetical protein
MSKGKKRCYFCGCNLTNQNKTAAVLKNNRANPWQSPWVDCCHGCKSKEDKKP